MKNYVFAYHGGKEFKSPAEGKKHMTRWMAWSNSLGDAWVNRGSPVGMSKTVSSSGVANNGGSNPLCGYSVVNAKSMDAALEIAKKCPHIDIGGSIEVAEVMDMEM